MVWKVGGGRQREQLVGALSGWDSGSIEVSAVRDFAFHDGSVYFFACVSVMSKYLTESTSTVLAVVLSVTDRIAYC